MTAVTPQVAFVPKDFASDQEVRWCPGCGDYAILKATQKALADVGATPDSTVFVSGIGCSSRFPYYLATYGFHTIHGRAPAVATGVKLARPDLDVWIATGDGDGLSIGGNHLLHVLRRNVDLQILLFNNEIYGLTKGQYSPTSHRGTHSPSSPRGTQEEPVSPAQFALGAGGRFVARAIDTQQKPLVEILKAAHAHRGASFIEIFQNCVVYNDNAFATFTERAVAAEMQLWVAHGKPLLFANGARGLRLKPGTLTLEAVTIGEAGITAEDILVHDQTSKPLALMLAALEPPAMPVALGVLYCNPTACLPMAPAEGAIVLPALPQRIDAALRLGDTWTIEPRAGG